MKVIVTAICFLLCKFSLEHFSEKGSCKVEIYLLNKVLPGIDTINRSCKAFLATKPDLEDTPFIRDEEILSFAILKDTGNEMHKVTRSCVFEVLNTAPKKINNLASPMSGGRQFAVVANNTIIYCGYFWNSKSTLKWDWILAYANENWIVVQPKWPIDENGIEQDDERESPVLIDCLKKTNRLIE